MESEEDIRESVFAWLRARMLTTPVFARDDLADVEVAGRRMRLVGTQTGIWKPRELSAALSIVTGYYADTNRRPYADDLGDDNLLRYKWRGTDGNLADNRWLRSALEQQVPLIWFHGIGHRPGGRTQLFQPMFPVWLIGEEPELHQFVVGLEPAQLSLIERGRPNVNEIERRYNLATVRQRLHQPIFRSKVLHAYTHRCAVCRLPFDALLDAAHIRSDSEGGRPAVPNGLALCRIHHGAFDADILGISPDYRVSIQTSVLDTFDGPTLQHALKEMHGLQLAQLPTSRAEQPDRELLAERFERFQRSEG